MACHPRRPSLTLRLTSLVFFFSCFLSFNSINGFVLPVRKDPLTLQYVAEIFRDESLVVDLGGSFIWRDCSFVYAGRPIRSVSLDCAKARAHQSSEGTENGFSASGCNVLVQNHATSLTGVGQLMEGGFIVESPQLHEIQNLNSLLSACAPSFLLRGLSRGARGVMGLGKAHISLTSQLAAKIDNHRRRFILCVSSSTGVVATKSVDSLFGAEISRSFKYTPLIANPRGEYLVGVNSIEIGGQKLPIVEPLRAELSTISPYTTMESSVYEKFIGAYSETIQSMNGIKIVESTAPFGVCFVLEENSSGTGEVNPPVVEFVLQSELIRWRMGKRNTVVDQGGGVSCLGVVDGGAGQVNPIVFGGLQLEERILEFDLGGSLLGFGSRKGCSGISSFSSL